MAPELLKFMYRSIQGLQYRWTEHSILPMTTEGGILNSNNATQTHSIFVILLENTFLGMPKVKAWSIFTLSMAVGQN